MMASTLWFWALLVLGNVVELHAFTTTSPAIMQHKQFTHTSVYAAADDRVGDDEESSMSEAQRMEMVRSLQKAFYSSPSEDDSSLPHPQLDPKTGILSNLPLWRVGWVEVPGRANCLNVHEGQYTHMFETIVNGPKPWYVGHLHLPGGFKMTRTGERQYDLKSWRAEIDDDERFQTAQQRSAVVGSLMKITDFRRMADGRLCILVHVLERFVVDSVVQSFPYSVANVQILPDLEQYDTESTKENDEASVQRRRSEAVVRAFQFHDYECDGTIELPLPKDEEYVTDRDIQQREIGKLLPFAFF